MTGFLPYPGITLALEACTTRQSIEQSLKTETKHNGQAIFSAHVPSVVAMQFVLVSLQYYLYF